MRWYATLLSSLLISTLLAQDALAFKLRPEDELNGKLRAVSPRTWIGRFIDTRAAWAIEQFTTPVHEQITNKIWGCLDPDSCLATDPKKSSAPAAVIAGVRWNDNPPFELVSTSMKDCTGRTIWLPNFSDCWYKLFKDGEIQAQKGQRLDLNSGAVIMLRSHFGDLQFLHAMASADTESAAQTRDKVLIWAELAWRVAQGEYKLGTFIVQTNVPNVKEYFRPGETVQTLFTRGNPTHRSNIREFAIGALLHTVQDSFSRSHVDRAEPLGTECAGTTYPQPGRIRKFLNYASQDSAKHAHEDASIAVDLQLLQVQPNVVDVGQVLKSMFDNKADWPTARQYLECVFEVENEHETSGPGTYQRDSL